MKAEQIETNGCFTIGKKEYQRVSGKGVAGYDAAMSICCVRLTRDSWGEVGSYVFIDKNKDVNPS